MVRKRERPVVAPAFGAQLTALRERVEGRSQEWVVRALASRFGLSFSRSTLSQYEKGTVLAPDAGILWGLAQIYDVPVMGLIQYLVAERSGGKVTVPEVTAGVHTAQPLSAVSGDTHSSTPAWQEARVAESENVDLELFGILRGAWRICPASHRALFALHCANYAAGLASGREATGTGPKE
jgi:transcriptional regulator with XRE-family HTH domain